LEARIADKGLSEFPSEGLPSEDAMIRFEARGVMLSRGFAIYAFCLGFGQDGARLWARLDWQR